MADNLDARARLSLSVDGLQQAIKEMDRAIQAGDDLDKAWSGVQKTFSDISAAAKKAGDAGESAGKRAGDAAKEAASGWKAYTDALEKANRANVKATRKGVMSSLSPSDVPEKSAAEMSRAELSAVVAVDKARKANIASDARARLKSITDTEAAEKRAAEATAKFQDQLRQRSMSKEMQRLQQLAQANRKAAAEYAKGIARPDGLDKSASLTVGSPRTDAQRSLRAAGASGWDRQFAAAESAIGAVSQAEAALPRLRYALYDVATTAGITSTAITGLGVAATVAFASMESSFTNVERTLDNAAPEQVAALRSELVGLSREIPQTFANIAEIATLGNQLGIASQDIAKFTETTAKFSAVTGLTAEASAQAFGSLGELLNVQSRDYEALGSSIALVGRKSVATEQEIVSMTTRLAASATNAGFTAQQVIALSGAFASLRIAPERAQGVMEIYFKTLNTAISEGGPRLEAFARTAGVTTAEVENLVRTDPVAFFERLATGLGQMDQIAQTGALAELGLQGIRAGEVFGRVSANVEVFNQALQDANQGWVQGTELGDQYAKVVDDLASRWQIFLNGLQEAGAAIGATLAPALGVLLSNLTDMLQAFAAFNSNPLGQFVTGAAVAIAALIAGITGLVAMGALGVAAMAAMKTALAELTIASGSSVLSLRTLSAGISSVGAAAGFSTGTVRAFKAALITTGIGALAVVLGTVVAGIMEAGSAANGFSAEAQQMGEALNRAIDSDTAAFFEGTGTAVSVYSRELESTAPAADTAAQAARIAAGAQDELSASTQQTTDKISEQVAVLGEQSEALFRNNLAEDPKFSNFANDPALLATAKQAGFNVDQMIAQGMAEGGSFAAYVENMKALSAELQQRAQGTVDLAARDELYAQASAINAAVSATRDWAAAQDEGRAAADAASASYSAAGATATDAGYAIADAGDAAAGSASGMWDAAQAALDAENQLFSLGTTLGENAGMWDMYSEAGRGNLSALYSWMTAVAGQTGATTSGTAANFAAMYQALIEGGVATANQLLFLRDAAASLAGMSFENIRPATTDFSNLFNGIQNGAQRAARAIGGGGGGGGGSVAKAVRTLIDYARDLEGVFKRAFDIRFGNQSSLDGVRSGWIKIAEGTAKAREEIAEYQATLAGIAADRKIKEYWLSVAEGYGDELRATKLRAELAELSDDQAKAQKDLAKAQGDASKTLTGNSKAAIENRETILDMVGGYQDLLKSYAENGMSQKDLERKAKQLKAEFIAQATQAGFSRAEIMRYASSFDDMTVAIQRVPRKITVDANPNPALQALAEFEAKAKSKMASAGRSAGGAFGGGFKGGVGTLPIPNPRPASNWTDLGYKQGRAMRAGVINGIGVIKIGNRSLMPAGSEAELYGWASGGYTGGNVGTNQIAGFVHGQEYVMSAPAVRTLGVNGMNFMHNMLKSGRIPSMGGGAGGGMVELSPYDRSLLVGIQQAVGITIGGNVLQTATNGGNANAAQRRVA